MSSPINLLLRIASVNDDSYLILLFGPAGSWGGGGGGGGLTLEMQVASVIYKISVECNLLLCVTDAAVLVTCQYTKSGAQIRN